MAEKTIKRNLMIERAHWTRLGVIAANAGLNRAQLVRVILGGVCDAKDPTIYLPSRAAAWTQLNQPIERRMEMAPPREAMSTYATPRPSQAPPMYPPKAPAVFDPVAAADWYKKGLVRFKGDRAEALAYTRRCVSLLPKEWVPPQDDVGDTADTESEEMWVCVQCFTVTPVSNPNCGSCGQPRPPMPIPAQPQKHDVPDDWLNRFGLTQDQQDSYLEDYALDYWPPDLAPEPEPFPDEWFEEYGPLEGRVNPRTGQRWTPPDAAPDTNGVAH
jgi:hypothetical protein